MSMNAIRLWKIMIVDKLNLSLMFTIEIFLSLGILLSVKIPIAIQYHIE